MKTAVVFYSFEGNTKFVSRALAKKMSADLVELKPVKDIKTHGFLKYFWGGMAAVLKKTPQLQSYVCNTNDYDLILLATPIWANTLTPALRTFITENDFSSTNIALLTCNASGQQSNAPSEVARLVDKDLIGNHNCKNPFFNKDTEAVNTAEIWATDLIK